MTQLWLQLPLCMQIQRGNSQIRRQLGPTRSRARALQIRPATWGSLNFASSLCRTALLICLTVTVCHAGKSSIPMRRAFGSCCAPPTIRPGNRSRCGTSNLSRPTRIMKTAILPLTLTLAFAFNGLTVSASESNRPAKPNIVLILTDDLGWQDVKCYDIDEPSPMETQNLDALAKKGVMFWQAYSPAPTCAPSRAAILSGDHPARAQMTHVSGGKPPRPHHPTAWGHDISLVQRAHAGRDRHDRGSAQEPRLCDRSQRGNGISP